MTENTETKVDPTDGSPFTEVELRLAAQSGMEPAEIRQLMAKDRLLTSITIISDLIERSIKERKIMAHIIEQYELNEREAHTMATTLGEAEKFAMMGFGPVVLVSMFQIGVEFAGKEAGEYTDEDRADWAQRIAANIERYTDEEPAIPDLTPAHNPDDHTPEMTPAERAMLEDANEAG